MTNKTRLAHIPMSGRRPFFKGFLPRFANVSGAVMSTACLCGKDHPAGPDELVRFGNSPNHSIALVSGAWGCIGFRPYPLAHITPSVTLESVRLAAQYFSANRL